MYETEPEPGLNGRRLRYPRGKVLGGCSSINGMIYMRGQARDYDSWAEMLGDEEWSWERALPDFVAHEAHWRMEAGAGAEFARLHGGGGGAPGRAAAGALSDPRRLRRGLRRGGDPAAGGLQRRRQRGGRLFRGEPARRGCAGTPRSAFLAAGARAAEPRGADRGRGGAAPPRAARGGARLHRGRAGRTASRVGGAARGGAERGGGEQPEAPAALGAGAGGAAPGARDRGGGGPAGGRRQPAGPPADPERLQGDGAAAR